MKPLPVDWKDDRRLWDLLGSLKPAKPPSNFTFMVRQKVSGEKRPAVELPGATIASLLALRRWVWGLAAAAACLLVAVGVMRYQALNNPANGRELIEVAQIAEHCEMLQDLEVIENLDELL